MLDNSTVSELMTLANAVIKMPSKVNPTPTKTNANNSQTLSKRK